MKRGSLKAQVVLVWGEGTPAGMLALPCMCCPLSAVTIRQPSPEATLTFLILIPGEYSSWLWEGGDSTLHHVPASTWILHPASSTLSASWFVRDSHWSCPSFPYYAHGSGCSQSLFCMSSRCAVTKSTFHLVFLGVFIIIFSSPPPLPFLSSLLPSSSFRPHPWVLVVYKHLLPCFMLLPAPYFVCTPCSYSSDILSTSENILLLTILVVAATSRAARAEVVNLWVVSPMGSHQISWRPGIYITTHNSTKVTVKK